MLEMKHSRFHAPRHPAVPSGKRARGTSEQEAGHFSNEPQSQTRGQYRFDSAAHFRSTVDAGSHSFQTTTTHDPEGPCNGSGTDCDPLRGRWHTEADHPEHRKRQRCAAKEPGHRDGSSERRRLRAPGENGVNHPSCQKDEDESKGCARWSRRCTGVDGLRSAPRTTRSTPLAASSTTQARW